MLISISPPSLWTALLSGTDLDIVDVCLPEDAEALGLRLPGSRTAPHRDVSSPGPAVVACHRGLKLSQGAAAALRARNVEARYLEGGRVAWHEAGFPMVRRSALSEAGLYAAAADPFPAAAFMRWIVDRLLPPGSQCLTVPNTLLPEMDARFGATILSSPGAALAQFGLVTSPLRGAAIEAERSDGAFAPFLRGVARAHGTDVGGQRAARTLFDAYLLGDGA